jgi:hypothetical protein
MPKEPELSYGALVETSSGLHIDLGGGLTLPAGGIFSVPASADFPYDVTIRYRWWEGRFEAVAVHLDAREDNTVTGEVLRRVPVARLLREHLAATVRIPKGFAKDADDELVRVAAVYRIAYMAHEAPVQAVAEHLGISTSTAGKKVMAAREKAYLPKTTRGKAGA